MSCFERIANGFKAFVDACRDVFCSFYRSVFPVIEQIEQDRREWSDIMREVYDDGANFGGEG